MCHIRCSIYTGWLAVLNLQLTTVGWNLNVVVRRSILTSTVNYFQRIKQTILIFNLNFIVYPCCKTKAHLLCIKMQTSSIFLQETLTTAFRDNQILSSMPIHVQWWLMCGVFNCISRSSCSKDKSSAWTKTMKIFWWRLLQNAFLSKNSLFHKRYMNKLYQNCKKDMKQPSTNFKEWWIDQEIYHNMDKFPRAKQKIAYMLFPTENEIQIMKNKFIQSMNSLFFYFWWIWQLLPNSIFLKCLQLT